MKAAVARKPVIRIAVVESDPLRFVGFRALFDSEPEFELVSAALPEISTLQGIDLILLGNRSGQNLFDVMASLKATRPDLRIIVTGSGIDEETILKAIASGAKGYVDEAATPAEFAQAIRIVQSGIGLGSTPGAFDVHRASVVGSGANLPRRPRDLYRSREGSPGDAGGRPLEQRDRRPVRH